MFNNNGRLAVHAGPAHGRAIRRESGRLDESHVPSRIPKLLEVLVHDIRRHDGIHYQLPESNHFRLGSTNRPAQEGKGIFVQEGPSNVNRILLGDAPVGVGVRHGRGLRDQLRVGDTGVVDIMNERRENTGELGQGIRGNSIGVIVQEDAQLTPCVAAALCVIDGIRSHDTTQELGNGHGDMGRVLEVVKAVGGMVHALRGCTGK